MSTEDPVSESESGEDLPDTDTQVMKAIDTLRSRVESLEEENQDLREDKKQLEEQVSQMQVNYVTRTSFNILLQALTGAEINDMTADPVQSRDYAIDFNNRVDELEADIAKHEDKISNIGEGESSGPEEAWHNITEAAKRLSGSRENILPNNRVTLYVDNISQATGKSERMASNYIDRFGGDGKHSKRGVKKRDYKPPSSSNGGEARKKSLVVDLDVWGDDDD